MTPIETQIANREAQIQKINNDLGQLRGSIPTLQSSLAGIICRGNKQQKADCNGRKSSIQAMIIQRQSKIRELVQRIDVLNKEIGDLSSQRESEGIAIVNLSNQGLTPAAVLANTTAQADAAREVATAQARSIEAGAANKQVIVWVVAIVIAIVVLLFIRKKLA